MSDPFAFEVVAEVWGKIVVGEKDVIRGRVTVLRMEPDGHDEKRGRSQTTIQMAVDSPATGTPNAKDSSVPEHRVLQATEWKEAAHSLSVYRMGGKTVILDLIPESIERLGQFDASGQPMYRVKWGVGYMSRIDGGEAPGQPNSPPSSVPG